MPIPKQLNAQKLIAKIRKVCRDNYVHPRDVQVNWRHDNNSDVFPLQRAWKVPGALSGKPISEISFVAWQSHCFVLTAQQLIDSVKSECRNHRVRLRDVQVTFRFNFSSQEAYSLTEVEEDLFDSDSNSVLETIVLLTEPGETEAL